jgi:hypothetical protein
MEEKFDKPIGEWIEEDVQVLKHKFDLEKKRVVSVYEMEKQKTMYINAPKEKYRCKNGEHEFVCIDKHKYIFSCTKCQFCRKVYPTKYMYNSKTKKLIDKSTGIAI